jgi:hypothetical protein
MLVVLAVAAGAALAVITYNHVRERNPELAAASMRRVHQLAAVVVVITSGVEKAFEALQSGHRPQAATGYRRPFDDNGYTNRPGFSSRPLSEVFAYDDLEDE